MSKSRRAYAAEFRRQLVELAHAGRAPEELAREFEPTAQSIGVLIAEIRVAHAASRGSYGAPRLHASGGPKRGAVLDRRCARRPQHRAGQDGRMGSAGGRTEEWLETGGQTALRSCCPGTSRQSLTAAA